MLPIPPRACRRARPTPPPCAGVQPPPPTVERLEGRVLLAVTTPKPVPGLFQAEDYDAGGQGVGYFDTTVANLGDSAYRGNDRVDLTAAQDAGGGLLIGWTRPGEWLRYTIDVAQAGTYTLESRLAVAGSGGVFHVEVNGTNRTGPIRTTSTGGWQTWRTVSTPGLSLGAGRHALRVVMDSTVVPDTGIANFNWFRLTRSGTPSKSAVSVFADDASASESGPDRGAFRFTRTGDASPPLTIWFTRGGTATNGADYQRIGESLTFAAGATSAALAITPIADSVSEPTETVTLTLLPSSRFSYGPSRAATVNIADRAGTAPANRPPARPTVTEPRFDGQVVSGADVHMETMPFADPDAARPGSPQAGQTHRSSDFEIWTTGAAPVRVWRALNITDFRRVHVHFGDGVFEGPLAGRAELPPDQDFTFRARHRDGSGRAGTDTSPWAERRFRTAPVQQPVPSAPDWTVEQAGYKVERVPVKFAAGEGQFRLPVNIVFHPSPGPQPGDPLFYVTELYGTVRVVTRDYTVRTYASGLLNYDPTGPFPGSGEQGLTGLAIDPASGDLFVAGLYEESPGDKVVNRAPRVIRLRSNDGGLTAATRTEILRMTGESQGQSHQISNVSIGPADGKLYVHNGDGFDFTTAQNLNSYRGKVLRLNLNGSAPGDNPFYNAADGITARDYVWAYGLRNPFGGAWRAVDGQHYIVENGPGTDRLMKLRRGHNFGWDGTDASMRRDAIYNWSPATGPVNLAFVQPGTFGGSGFPSSTFGRAFVTLSGPTYATGPNARGKRIEELVLDAAGNLVTAPRTLVRYTGSGKATVAALAAGPDGLYFSDLYEDGMTGGAFVPTAAGANILRVRYVG